MVDYESNRSAEELENDIREKVEVFKDTAKEVVYRTVDWMMYHPEETAALIGGLMFAWRKIDKYVDIRREVKLRNSMIYDRSLGMYWQTKRPLTANQRLQIESRHKAGEPYGKILSEMKILKR